MKKLIAAAVLAVAIMLDVDVGFALEPRSAVLSIAADSPCPAAGCASGECHGFGAVPEPDGVHEMVCPEAGCAYTVECHAWDSLAGRYRQASDASLNLWILMPTVPVLGLWLMARRMGRNSRANTDSGEVCHEA